MEFNVLSTALELINSSVFSFAMVKAIQSKQDFDSALNSERAIIFVHFSWAGSSHLGKRLVEVWEQTLTDKTLSIYCLESDFAETNALIYDWLVNQVQEKRGNGSLVWLKQSSIRKYELDVSKLSIEELNQKTKEVFPKVVL